MRADPLPTLFEGPHCAACPIDCVDRRTDAACTLLAPDPYSLHPARPSDLDQWHAWSTSAGPPAVPTIPVLPGFFPRVTRDIAQGGLRDVPTSAVALTIENYLGICSRAERAGTAIREYLGKDTMRIVVVGADRDRTGARYWADWKNVRSRLHRHRPDLVVGPDLGLYGRDQPAMRNVHRQSHQRMYSDLVGDGLDALPVLGWTFWSDIERFATWAREHGVPGAFVDLQNRHGSSFDEDVEDLRRVRGLFPPDFMWIINGVQVPARWAQLRDAVGRASFTSEKAWHISKSRLVIDPYLEELTSDLDPLDAFAASVVNLARAAALADRPRRPQQLGLPLKGLDEMRPGA